MLKGMLRETFFKDKKKTMASLAEFGIATPFLFDQNL